MSSEATVSCGIQVKKNNFQYKSPIQSFKADVSEGKGPTPSFITITINGVDIDLTKLDAPGLASITNIDDTYSFGWGIKDTSTGHYFEVALLHPGESYPIRFSPYIGSEFTDTGTGTGGGGGGTLHARAYVGPCQAQFDVLDT